MKNLYAPFFALAFLVCQSASAQRYLSPVFTDVTMTSITYGANATFLGYAIPTIGQAFTQALKADVYTPTGDTETNRPVVIYWHSGNFLPHPSNLGISNNHRDSTPVEVCKRLARMGYVAISADYRVLWNPTSGDQTTRVFTLINAAYRGVQDVKTMSKYIKRTVAEQGNPLGVDPNKICMFGHGTGGYMTLAASTLDTITETYLPKFALSLSPFVPMVIESINGDVEVEKYGTMPVAIPGLPYKVGDTLNIPQHVGYSTKFNMAINLGGALGDLSWIAGGKGAANVPPTISFHCPTDPNAPYDCGVLTVPGVNFQVVEVCGGHKVQQAFDAAGINNIWKNNVDLEAIGLSKKDNPEGLTGLFNVYAQTQKGVVTTSPWDIWAWTNLNALPPSMSPAGLNDSIAARIYIDTIVAYCAPRMCLALGLGCDFKALNTTILDEASLGLEISPNPASEEITFATEEKNIESIYVFDLSGRLVKAHVEINSNRFTMPRNALGTGLYFAELRFANGIVTKKIMFD